MQRETEQFIRSLFDQYMAAYATRDERIIGHFSEDFSGFAAADDAITGNLADWIEVTRRNFARVPGPIHIGVRELVAQAVSDNVVILTAVAESGPAAADGASSPVIVRHVQVRRREGVEWRIVHSSTSSPDDERKEDVNPVLSLAERNRFLEALAEERTRELEEAKDRLTQLSETDALTGVGNRRRFDGALSREWPRAPGQARRA